MTEKKKKKVSKEETLQRTEYQRVGDVLREAREAKGLTVEAAAAAIHIRAAQVRAIEDGNLDGLPGITYATGFIRSYATYLKLDSTEIVTRFKAENSGAAAARPELNFPEPLAEDKMPSILMIGFGAFCALILLVGWVMFSGGDEGEQVADIPAPVVATQTAATPFVPMGTAAAVAPVTTTTSTATETVTVTADVPVTTETTPAQLPLTTDPAAAATTAAPATVPATTAAPVEDVSSAVNTAAAPVAAPAVDPAAAATSAATAAAAPAAPAATEEIKIAPVKSRVLLRATGTSWVQVVNSQRQIIFKKVLRKGEQYAVPDVKGLTLMASNGGGLDVYVDGQKSAPVGTVGEIVRGMSLDAGSLKKRRTRVQDY